MNLPNNQLRIHFTNHHSHSIDLNDNKDIAQLTTIMHKEKVEECLEGLNFLLTAPYTLPDPRLVLPLKKLAAHASLIEHLQIRQYSRMEPLPYIEERGYGGVYIAFDDGGATGYIAGNPKAVLPLCKGIYDLDEYAHLDKKWRQSGYTTVLIASREESDNNRNILIRGLKNSLNILALVGAH